MNIPVILNGNKIILEAQADEPLMSVLQKKGCSSVNQFRRVKFQLELFVMKKLLR